MLGLFLILSYCAQPALSFPWWAWVWAAVAALGEGWIANQVMEIRRDHRRGRR